MPTAWHEVRRTLAFDFVLLRELSPSLGALFWYFKSHSSEINAKGESLFILEYCHFASKPFKLINLEMYLL